MKSKTHQFGKYFLERRIAVGGMAEVFKATFSPAEGIEKDVALKIILPDLNEEEEYRNLFVEEAKISVKFNHPNIVQVYDFGEISQRYFFAMEYIQGLNAKSLIKKSYREQSVIPIEIACEIVRQILFALDYAHNLTINQTHQDVIHRDVSPQNILISFDGIAKLTDFGIAKTSLRSSKTKTGVVRGKIKYMSPEQAYGKEVDQRTDQYALGIVFYELLVGMNTGDSEMIGPDLAPVTAYRKEVPGAIEKIIKKMTSSKKEDRFSNCKEIIREIDTILQPFPSNNLRKRLGQWVQGVETKYPSANEDLLIEPSSQWKTVNRSYVKRAIRPGISLVFFLVVAFVFFPKYQEWMKQDAAAESVRIETQKEVSDTPPNTKNSKQVADISPAKPTSEKAASKIPIVKTQARCPRGMIKITGGSFLYGSEEKDPDRNAYTETLLHDETLNSFCIDQYEYPNQKGQFPITGTPWEQASQMCGHQNKRLCSEAEWERACKGPDQSNRNFSYGSTFIAESCNVGNQEPNSLPSGSLDSCVTDEKVYDLTGNVEEWVSSSGRFRKDFKLTKGGASHISSWAGRCASNQESSLDKKSPWIGFRCCKSL